MSSPSVEMHGGVVRQLTIGVGQLQKDIERVSFIFGPKMLFARKVSEVRPGDLLKLWDKTACDLVLGY
jgi:hypothetical protein